VPRILYRYLLSEVLLYTVIGFAAVAAILVSQNLLRRVEELAVVGFTGADVLAVFACVFSMLAAYVVPVAFLFGTLVAFGRLSADSEVTAMRACGLGVRSLLAPVLALGLLASALTAVLVADVEPRARRELRAVLNEIASRGALIEPGVFRKLDARGSRLLLVQAQEDGTRLEGVMIVDRSDPERPFTVFAEWGRFVFDEARSEIHIVLENGSLHFDPGGGADERYRYVSFASLDYGVDASALLEDETHLRPREMSVARIREVLAHFEAHSGAAPEGVRETRRSPYEVQLQRRVALPLAPVWFALIGVPLGIRRTRGARSYGVLVCLALVLSYYALLSLGETLAEEEALPAAIALWIPNLAFAAVALGLLRRLRYTEI
jgi:lipopolysaccharide export system permease protein